MLSTVCCLHKNGVLTLKITPLDIRKQEFRKAMRGFDREEVMAFLEIVADEFERLNQENATLQESANVLESAIGEYRKMEKTLQDTLLTAQATAEEARQNAKKEAELIVKEARGEAQDIIKKSEQKGNEWIDEAEKKVRQIEREGADIETKLERDIMELKRYRNSLTAKLKSHLSAQLELLESNFDDEQGMEILTEPADEVSMTETQDEET